MPRIRLTKSAIDALTISSSDVVYWDIGLPGFGVTLAPKGRKVFIVLYRTGGAGSKLRKYTIGLYGRITLRQARVAAEKVFAARLNGRDPAAEKRETKRRVVADRVEDLLETYIAQRLSQNRSGGEISRLLRREVGKPWARIFNAVPLIARRTYKRSTTITLYGADNPILVARFCTTRIPASPQRTTTEQRVSVPGRASAESLGGTKKDSHHIRPTLYPVRTNGISQ